MFKPIVYLAILSCSLLNISDAEVLKGVTVLHSPYIELNDGKLEGFANDLAKELADKFGFTYSLELAPDGKYGQIVNNTINGMLGEVYSNRADFAIADITVTEGRKQFVDFTEPFLDSDLVILIHKQYANNISSFADLADQTLVEYGIMRNGHTHQTFSKSNDSTIHKMYEHMEANPNNYINHAESKDRMMTSPYAMLVERPYAEQMVGQICDITFIVDTNAFPTRQFAIALPKGSAYLDRFNTAIKELKTSGRIDNMLQRYRKRCGVLKGVTIPTKPYSQLSEGMMSGLSVDLMNEISAINNFSYSLYLTYGEWYGGFYEQDVRGMIGDVYRKLADFAIADITVTDVRKTLVDFTEPLFDTGVVLIINKNNANISSFKDLAQQTDIKYGFLNESSTHNLFRESADPTMAQMYRTMSESSDAFLPTLREGIRRAKDISTGFAFFTEGMVAEYIVGQNCDLSIISDPEYPFPRQYAIALPKNSTYIQGFNSAISQLKTNGVINTLKAKYWRKCA